MKKILITLSVGIVIVFGIILNYVLQENSFQDEVSGDKLVDNHNDTVIFTSLLEGEKIAESNGKIYFSDGDSIYEISDDLSSSKVLLNNSDSFIRNGHALYTNKARINLFNGAIEELNNLIYIDNEIQILHPYENTFKILNRLSNLEKEFNLANAEFIKRIGDKLFFQSNMVDYSYLYYMDINNLKLKCINREKRISLWSNVEGKLGYDFNKITEDWQLSKFMNINDVNVINNKVYYRYVVTDCDLSDNGVGAGYYDKRIIEIELDGKNRRVRAERYDVDDNGIEVNYTSGPDFGKTFDYIEYNEKFSKDYSVKFDDEYLYIMWENGSIAHRRKLQPDSNEEEILHWNDASIIELKDYLYVNEVLYQSWRGDIVAKRDYFINKHDHSVVIFKDGKFVEYDKEYEIPVAEDEAIFINSIKPSGKEFLVQATIYEPYSLSEMELKEKIDKNETICIDGISYKVVELNNEYCLKSDIDDNYVSMNSEGKMFISWGDPRVDVFDFYAYKITGKKVEFLLEKEAVLTGNQFVAPIKEIYDEWWPEDETYIPTEEKFITFETGIYHTFFDPETGKCAELGSLRIGG